MNVDLLIKENKELSEEKQRYKDMWFTTNNSLAKYRKLEEELGCSLEVRCNVVCDSYIYDENGTQYKVVYVYEDHFDCEDPFDNDMGYTKLCAFNWKDHKKTWWLKEDRSE